MSFIHSFSNNYWAPSICQINTEQRKCYFHPLETYSQMLDLHPCFGLPVVRVFAEGAFILLWSSAGSAKNSSPGVSPLRKGGMTWAWCSILSYAVLEVQGLLVYLWYNFYWRKTPRWMAIQFLHQHLLKGYHAWFYQISYNINSVFSNLFIWP